MQRWKSESLLSVPSSGICYTSLQGRLVRTGKWMRMLRISTFRIPSDDRISTELTVQKIRHTSWKWTFILVPCHSLCRLIPVEYYRGLFDIKGETRGHQASGTVMLTGILLSVREFGMQPATNVAYLWAALQHEFMKSCYPYALL